LWGADITYCRTDPGWVYPAFVTAMVAEGKPGRAMVTFLTEVVGLTQDQVTELRDAAPVEDVLAIVSRTMAREADALSTLDLAQLAAAVNQPVRLMLGAASPPWAGAVTTALAQQLRSADVWSYQISGMRQWTPHLRWSPPSSTASSAIRSTA